MTTHAAGRLARRALVLGALLLLAGCATPLTQNDLEDRLRSAGGSVRGLGKNFVIAPIHADSKVAAWTLMAEAKSDGSMPMARRLSHDFKRGAKRRRAVVVGGPYASLTRAVVLDAFAQLEGQTLRGLTLVYVGDASEVRDLRVAARDHQVRFYHRPLD